MSGVVSFDRKGVFGPAMTLIYSAESYNPKGVLELTELLKKNFMILTQLKPKGKKEFCAFIEEKNKTLSPITPTEVVSTKFFQNMQKKSAPSSLYHEKVLGLIVPQMMKTVREQFSQANNEEESQKVYEWTAGFVETYMTEEQIKNQCQLIQEDPENRIMEERKAIGVELYNAAKVIKEQDLDILLDICNVALDRIKAAPNPAITLHFAGRYLTLFAMKENPKALGDQVLNSLTTIFRSKWFPKKETSNT